MWTWKRKPYQVIDDPSGLYRSTGASDTYAYAYVCAQGYLGGLGYG
jgi:hypothetical protein